MIGKTLELEFKLQKKDSTTKASIAARKQLAQSILREVSKTPDIMAKLMEGRMSENIFYNHFTGATIDQLPAFYKTNSKLIEAAGLKTLSSLIEGKYETVSSQGKDNATTSTDLN